MPGPDWRKSVIEYIRAEARPSINSATSQGSTPSPPYRKGSEIRRRRSLRRRLDA